MIKNWISRITLIIILALGLACAGIWIFDIAQYIDMPGMEYSEGLIMYIGQEFAAGTWNWDISIGPPYMTSFYPHVYYSVLGHLINVFGDSLMVGRVLNLATAAACCFLCGLIVYTLTKHRWIALAGGLMPMLHPVFNNWSFIVRVDMMAVMWELAGIYFLLKYEVSRWQLVTILFFLLAVFTKQSILAGAAAAVVYLFWQNRRRGVAYGLILVAAAAGIIAIGSWLTGGGYFQEIFTYQQLSNYFKPHVDDYVIVGFLPLIPMLVLTLLYFTGRDRARLPLIYFTTSLVLILVLMFRLGGSHVYFLEIITATSIIAALSLHDLTKQGAIVVIGLPAFAISVYLLINSIINPIFPGEDYRQHYSEARDIIKNADYPILTENAQLVLDAGQQPYYDPFVFSNLARLGLWNEDVVISDLEQKRINYVVTEHCLPIMDGKRIDVLVQSAILQNYQVIYQTPFADLPLDDPRSAYQIVVYGPKEEP